MSDIPRFRYSEIRPNVRDGDIVLFSGNSGMSKAIKKFTEDKSVFLNGNKVQFTHVGIADWWNQRLMITEACDGDEVRHNSISNKYIKNKYDGKIFIARVNQDRLFCRMPAYEVMKRIAATVNYDYSELDIAKIAISKLFKMNITPGNDNKFYCSELVNYGYRFLFIDKNKFSVPTDIAMSQYIDFIAEIII